MRGWLKSHFELLTVIGTFVNTMRYLWQDDTTSYLCSLLVLALLWAIPEVVDLTREAVQGRKGLSVRAQRWSRSRDR